MTPWQNAYLPTFGPSDINDNTSGNIFFSFLEKIFSSVHMKINNGKQSKRCVKHLFIGSFSGQGVKIHPNKLVLKLCPHSKRHKTAFK